MNVLLIANDAPSGRRMVAIGRALESAGHRVAVFRAPTAPTGRPDAADPNVRPRWTADAVVASPWRLPTSAFFRGHVLVADGISIRPVETSTLAAGDGELERQVRRYERRARLVAARADAVLVAGKAQRTWWSGRLDSRQAPLVEIPSGIPDEDPPHDVTRLHGVPTSWAVVVWCGDGSPSLDLDTLFAARSILGGAAVSVVVPTRDPPSTSAVTLTTAEVMERASAHGLKPPQVVTLARGDADDEPHRILATAGVAALLHHPGPEAELAFRTRALDGLWAGVPLLVTEGGAVSDLVRTGGWGAVVPPREPRSTAAALELLLRDRTRSRCREAMTRDRDQWRWSRVALPMVDLLPELPVVERRGLFATALGVAIRRRRSREHAT